LTPQLPLRVLGSAREKREFNNTKKQSRASTLKLLGIEPIAVIRSIKSLHGMALDYPRG
jgi:hypothetical protein